MTNKIAGIITLLVAVLSIGGAGCSARPHKAEIVAVYQEDEDANDGAVQRTWRTTIHLHDTDGRAILRGQYGSTGETFTAWYDPVAQYWTANQ